MNTDRIRTYSELITFPTFKERLEYLRLDGAVGHDTFGFDRYLNQQLYNSQDWKRIRDKIIVRDNGCDLGIDGYFITGPVYIHHINPLLPKDLLYRTDYLMNPEYLICVSRKTHDAIHYGSNNLPCYELTERRPNDTCPWKT